MMSWNEFRVKSTLNSARMGALAILVSSRETLHSEVAFREFALMSTIGGSQSRKTLVDHGRSLKA